MKPNNLRDHKLIACWLFVGLVMVYFQIILGGITRLTGSGLSITRWDIVMGAVPPLNDGQWKDAFNLYMQTPQYQHINSGMELGEFKFIYFWEFFHRLWARTMGFIFLIPFLIFLGRKSFTRGILKNLFLVIFFAALAALFGWIMVASGLIERPWVNAYKLTIHLSLGILLFLSLFYTWINHNGFKKPGSGIGWHKLATGLLILGALQVIFGGFVSGMKSSLIYPSWPKMNGQWIPSVVSDRSHWNVDNFLFYDQSGFMPAMVLVIHRNLAYLILITIVLFSIKWYKAFLGKWQWVSILLTGIIVVQVSLGILTLMHSLGSIPVLYGALHQGLGILFITTLFYLFLITKPDSIR